MLSSFQWKTLFVLPNHCSQKPPNPRLQHQDFMPVLVWIGPQVFRTKTLSRTSYLLSLYPWRSWTLESLPEEAMRWRKTSAWWLDESSEPVKYTSVPERAVKYMEVVHVYVSLLWENWHKLTSCKNNTQAELTFCGQDWVCFCLIFS